MVHRPRRLRRSAAIRSLVRETRLEPEQLIYPLFVVEGSAVRSEIPTMKGQFHLSVDMLGEEVREIERLGIGGVLLFGLPGEKDETGSQAYCDQGIVQRAVREIRRRAPRMLIVTDLCMCEYTSHGHCGILGENGAVDNDKTLPFLARIAVSHARAGADIIAPSDMMDGRVGAIRRALDENGFEDIAVMSYSAKYASGYYGPFREAAGSAPRFGDRRSYQMDCANVREALRECALDVREGADIIMVKPALAYLDVIARVRGSFDVPLAAYSVSGEYAMLSGAMENGLLPQSVVEETLLSIRRAGADIIITYFAKDYARRYAQQREGRSFSAADFGSGDSLRKK